MSATMAAPPEAKRPSAAAPSAAVENPANPTKKRKTVLPTEEPNASDLYASGSSAVRTVIRRSHKHKEASWCTACKSWFPYSSDGNTSNLRHHLLTGCSAEDANLRYTIANDLNSAAAAEAKRLREVRDAPNPPPPAAPNAQKHSLFLSHNDVPF